jgi:hypothetical protein
MAWFIYSVLVGTLFGVIRSALKGDWLVFYLSLIGLIPTVLLIFARTQHLGQGGIVYSMMFFYFSIPSLVLLALLLLLRVVVRFSK